MEALKANQGSLTLMTVLFNPMNFKEVRQVYLALEWF
jgi:hypothetical protein